MTKNSKVGASSYDNVKEMVQPKESERLLKSPSDSTIPLSQKQRQESPAAKNKDKKALLRKTKTRKLSNTKRSYKCG